MTKKSLEQLRKENPVFLTIFWCDRCNRAVNQNEESHFHKEHCGCCKKYRQTDGDWGYCSNDKSVYCGRKTYEHDTCSKWIEGKSR